jgi:DHA1 family bicyclomycin/chloramphenicol resistance-like MFS transporter
MSASLLLLVGLVGASMSVFSDTVIAVLPALQTALAASDHDVQQLVSLFFAATALASLFVGALADAYGRRPVLLGSLLLLVVTSVGCAFAERLGQLWLLRIVQGAAACAGMILSRTIVRDLVSGVQAQRMISRVSLIQCLFPVLLPLLGAWIARWYGWRMVFVCTAALASLMLLAIARMLPETLAASRRHPLRPAVLAQAYRKVFGSGVFLRLAFVQALNWAAAFLYVAAAPKVMNVHLGQPSTEMYKLFAAFMLPLLLGLLLLPQLLQRLRPRAVLVVAYGCFSLAIALNLAVSAADIRTLIVLMPIALFSFGVGCSLPLLVGESLEPFPDNAGMASSCQMFVQYALMGLTAGVVAPLAWQSLLGLAVAQAGIVAVGFVLLLWQRRVTDKHAAAPA